MKNILQFIAETTCGESYRTSKIEYAIDRARADKTTMNIDAAKLRNYFYQ